ncbi:MAG: DUF3106 domain-containing protein [Planctomycetes bacterium]|nr:DUF3106 domain-containing protein [Planctomycetota bacterium]
MSDRRTILGVFFRLAIGILGVAGLVLLLLPGIARGLGREADLAPWAMSRRDDARQDDERLLSGAGLRISPQQLKVNRRTWAAMSEPERQELVVRLDRLDDMDDGQRQTLVDSYKQLQQLSEADREKLVRQAAALARFEASLGRQDLAVLDSLSGKDRARHLIRLWQARQQAD